MRTSRPARLEPLLPIVFLLGLLCAGDERAASAQTRPASEPAPAPEPARAPAPATPAPRAAPARDRATLVAGGDVSFGRRLGQVLLRDPGHDPFAGVAA